MTTTITPSSGAAPLYTQQGTGTTPGYSALDDRRIATAALQEGVYGTPTIATAWAVPAADFMVTQRAAGANLSVDINMPGGGMAFVQGDTIAGQGLYAVPVAASTINEAIAAADLTNPRVDQVILEVKDNVLDASGGNEARTRVLTGTPTAGATTSNRSGAAALPGSALLLADVLVAANATSIANSNIRDRRKWARGAFSSTLVTTGNYVITATAATEIDTAGLRKRVECSGAPLRLTLSGLVSPDTANQITSFGFFLDGGGVSSTGALSNVTGAATGIGYGFTVRYTFTPAAGSHLLSPTAWVTAGSKTVLATASNPLGFTIEELDRGNAVNSSGVTTG